MDDFGSANVASCRGLTYPMYIGGCLNEDAGRTNYGEWGVLLERHQTLMQILMGKNKIILGDPLIRKIEQILRSEGFEDVAV